LKSIIDATQYASNPENRKEISEAIAPKNYLNQPVPVIEQVLTGTYADGLGKVKQTFPTGSISTPSPGIRWASGSSPR
jgi:nitrate/nitrite transport system substrate-binding protein